jgi:trans-aconitate 2-methyltransferase
MAVVVLQVSALETAAVEEIGAQGLVRQGAVDFAGRYRTIGTVAEKVGLAVLECLPDRPNPLIVEIGCGTGETALIVALGRDDAHVTGFDISASNIAAAEAAKSASNVGDRVSFKVADVMSLDCPQADLVFCQSVLHLIQGDTKKLVERIAGTVRPGGRLVFTMPRACARNELLFLMRRSWSLVPQSIADRAALAVARRLYPQLPADLIADRLSYLRLVPERLDGPQLQRLLRANGLLPVRWEIWPVTTILQPSHSFSVWRKD